MLKLVKARIVLEILGIILLSVFIWFAGPYFAFADFRPFNPEWTRLTAVALLVLIDRKSTRLNSSHGYISYAVFCLKRKAILDHGVMVALGTPGEAVRSLREHLLPNESYDQARQAGLGAVAGDIQPAAPEDLTPGQQ